MEKILTFFSRHPIFFMFIVGAVYATVALGLFVGALLIIKAIFF